MYLEFACKFKPVPYFSGWHSCGERNPVFLSGEWSGYLNRREVWRGLQILWHAAIKLQAGMNSMCCHAHSQPLPLQAFFFLQHIEFDWPLPGSVKLPFAVNVWVQILCEPEFAHSTQLSCVLRSSLCEASLQSVVLSDSFKSKVY